MATLDTVSLTILFGALLMLAGILSSLVALRFGAPLLFVFLVVGMLAGESGPGGIKFDDVRTTYLVGSVALALDPVRRRAAHAHCDLPQRARAVADARDRRRRHHRGADRAVRQICARPRLDGGAAGRRRVASTDAAAVFFLIHARGLRLRPRVAATLEVESGTNDPFAIFLTLVLVEMLLVGDWTWSGMADEPGRQGDRRRC